MKARERKEEEAGLSPGDLMFGGLGPKAAGFMNPNSNPNLALTLTLTLTLTPTPTLTLTLTLTQAPSTPRTSPASSTQSRASGRSQVRTAWPRPRDRP